MDGTRMPKLPVDCRRSARATGLARYPSRSLAASTRWARSGSTLRSVPASTRDAVDRDTPAAVATSCRVARPTILQTSPGGRTWRNGVPGADPKVNSRSGNRFPPLVELRQLLGLVALCSGPGDGSRTTSEADRVLRRRPNLVRQGACAPMFLPTVETQERMSFAQIRLHERGIHDRPIRHAAA